MLRILQSSKTDNFDGITAADESWFQYVDSSSKLFTDSPADVVPMVRQTLGARKTMITLFFTVNKPIAMDVLPKDMKFNQPCCVHCIFPDLKRAT
jgi:hypothetical protein